MHDRHYPHTCAGYLFSGALALEPPTWNKADSSVSLERNGRSKGNVSKLTLVDLKPSCFGIKQNVVCSQCYNAI